MHKNFSTFYIPQMIGNSSAAQILNEVRDAENQLNIIYRQNTISYQVWLNTDLSLIRLSADTTKFLKDCFLKDLLIGQSIFEILNITEITTKTNITDYLFNNLYHQPIWFEFFLGNQMLYGTLTKTYRGATHTGYSFIITILRADIEDIVKEQSIHQLSLITNKIQQDLGLFAYGITKVSNKENSRGKKQVDNDNYTYSKLTLKQKKINLKIMKLNDMLTSRSKAFIIIPMFTEFIVKKILILDDEIPNQKRAIRLLRQTDSKIKALPFIDGSEAIDFLQTHPADLILLDMQMPEIDGWEFLALMKKKNINTPTILMCSYAITQTVIKALTYKQIRGVINKPMRLSDILMILQK